jgi:diketogulonate reductase-like aldo/keto reductase
MGFTSFDTARASEWYSEDQVAMSITSSSIPREELFVTTKIHPRELGYNETLRAGRESAARFLGYVDVLLLHYPRCWKGLCGEGDFYEEGAWKESWRAIEDLRLEGTVRVGGGVSNFGPRYVQWSATIPTIWIHTSYTNTLAHRHRDLQELGEIARNGGGEVVVIQDWVDPFHQSLPQQAFCSSIPSCTFMAYSSLGGQHLHRPPYKNIVLRSRTLRHIAKSHGVTIPTVVLSWQLQKEMAVVPRSTNPRHLR